MNVICGIFTDKNPYLRRKLFILFPENKLEGYLRKRPKDPGGISGRPVSFSPGYFALFFQFPDSSLIIPGKIDQKRIHPVIASDAHRIQGILRNPVSTLMNRSCPIPQIMIYRKCFIHLKFIRP